MDNYKIPNTEEAISLLDELGFDVTGLTDMSSFLYAKAQDKKAFNGVVNPENYEFISVAKLNDLVVLNRKNPADGNYRLFISDSQGELNLYKTSDDIFYVFSKELKGWDKSRAVNIKTANLIKKGNEKDPALISGDVALANVHKHIVQYLHDDEPYGRWTTITDNLWSQYHLGMFLDPDTKFKFRFKPQTIKLDLEIPAPYKAKIGGRDDISFVLNVGRHQYCYKTEEDYTKARDALEAVFDAAVRGTNS
ncbi:hypothetical protein [Acinetobacter baumannii]|uniref:hypothetical protein n=1 Tax=Acinetobacter baumannii TaxID=470 RepID=UPI000C9C70AC|nr:hypothetical protein [Acinetobacter baumannii]PNC50227.1 hypothetical protein CK480_10445 [Acinetobacter baumannii]